LGVHLPGTPVFRAYYFSVSRRSFPAYERGLSFYFWSALLFGWAKTYIRGFVRIEFSGLECIRANDLEDYQRPLELRVELDRRRADRLDRCDHYQ
jgi:hypothetical protein